MSGGLTRRWKGLFGGLGEALLELLSAELEGLRRDFARSGRGLLVVLGLVVAAGLLGFWLVAALVAFVVALLSIWLPVWGATLVAVGVLLVMVLALVGIAWWQLRRLEGPSRIVERRWHDHQGWWRERVLGERRRPPSEPG